MHNEPPPDARRLRAEHETQTHAVEQLRATLATLAGATLLVPQHFLDEIDEACASGIAQASRLDPTPTSFGALRA